jgi:uncharacterized membrane protein YoaK (UPF0700 family)
MTTLSVYQKNRLRTQQMASIRLTARSTRNTPEVKSDFRRQALILAGAVGAVLGAYAMLYMAYVALWFIAG